MGRTSRWCGSTNTSGALRVLRLGADGGVFGAQQLLGGAVQRQGGKARWDGNRFLLGWVEFDGGTATIAGLEYAGTAIARPPFPLLSFPLPDLDFDLGALSSDQWAIAWASPVDGEVRVAAVTDGGLGPARLRSTTTAMAFPSTGR
jgi:hypothetical protein